MKVSRMALLGLGCVLAACSSDSSADKGAGGAGTSQGGSAQGGSAQGGSAQGGAAQAGASQGHGGGSAQGGAASQGGASAGASAKGGSTAASGGAPPGAGGSNSSQGGEAAWRPSAMPLISRNVPAFSSGNGNSSSGPSKSNDADPASTWIPDKLPAWIAYDLSGVPAEQRHQVLVAWDAAHAGAYLLDNTFVSDASPIDYTIEINSAPGGGASPPSSGWEQIAAEQGNTRSSRQYLFDLKGANWVRMSVTKSTDPASVQIDLDVFSAPDGASDAWLFMGDSITHISIIYQSDDIPAQVNRIAPKRWPLIVPAAIGGTSTGTALEAIDETMKYFPGRFVVLAYGTNNHASNFDMESLAKKVLAAGKIPVIPHVPWSDTAGIQSDGPLMNQAIDALYEKYPQILRGPDLWEAFKNRTDLIPSGDVHPNSDGQVELRKQWAAVIAK